MAHVIGLPSIHVALTGERRPHTCSRVVSNIMLTNLQTVTATSKSAGTAVIENKSTGQKVSHSFSGESDALCETNAEWIVEDYSSGGSLVSFADFGTVQFTGASVNGGTGVSGSTIIDIQQSSKVLTDCSTSGSSTVVCSYTG